MKTAFRIASFIGSVFLLFFMGMLAPFIFSGGKFSPNMLVPPGIAFLFVPFAAVVLTYGLRHALWGFAGLSIFLRRDPLATMQEMVLRSAIRYIYATGVISFIGAIVLALCMGPWSEIRLHLGRAMFAILYSIILSEFLVRPALKRSELLRLEQTTGETHPSFRELWFSTLAWAIVITASILALGVSIYLSFRPYR